MLPAHTMPVCDTTSGISGIAKTSFFNRSILEEEAECSLLFLDVESGIKNIVDVSKKNTVDGILIPWLWDVSWTEK